MAIYTAAIAAQNTSIYLCDIRVPSGRDTWFANVALGTGAGTDFGGGTVLLQGSINGGTTKFTLTQDGTATAASFTAAGACNLRCGYPAKPGIPFKLYATIATATSPVVAIAVLDNFGS